MKWEKSLMGLGEKIADYVGKWLLICIGIITSIIAFTNAFKIRCNLAVIISVTICVVALFLLLVSLKHKYIIISIIAALLVGSVFLLHHELKIGILLCANQVIKAYMNYFDASAIGTFSIHFKSSDWIHNATQTSTLLCVFVIIEYAYILVTATWYK